MEKKNRLFLGDFAPNTYEEWLEEAKKSLKNKPIEKLFSKTYEGITINPIYTKKDLENIQFVFNEFPGLPHYLRNQKIGGYKEQRCYVTQSLNFPDPNEFNIKLKTEITNDVFSVSVNHLTSESRNYYGLLLENFEDFRTAFRDIDLSKLVLHFKSNRIFELGGFLRAFLEEGSLKPSEFFGSFNFDIITDCLGKGSAPIDFDDLLFEYFNQFSSNFPNSLILVVNGDLFHESGGNAVQEIAYSISLAVEYAKRLIKRNVAPKEIFKRMMFKFTVGSDILLEIAKIRAFRIVWSQVLEKFNLENEDKKIWIYAITSSRNKSRLDAYVNMIRNSGETYAALTAGADFIEVTPFDFPFEGLSSDFSLRNARNTQFVMIEEHNLADVIDPVGGSWYIESLTFELAKRALEMFKDIESSGGFYQNVIAGNIQDSINSILNKRLTNLALRKDVLVGVNKYPNLEEQKQIEKQIFTESDFKKLIAERVQRRKENLSELITSILNISELARQGFSITNFQTIVFQENIAIKQLTPVRLSERFENLRNFVESYRQKYAQNPKAFIINYGTVSNFRLRADFSIDFLRVGGFETIESLPVQSVEEAAKAFFESQCPIAVICSSDDLYPNFVPQISMLIKKAKPLSVIVLAGLPTDEQLIDLYKKSGVDAFIHIRANILDILNEIYKLLSVV